MHAPPRRPARGLLMAIVIVFGVGIVAGAQPTLLEPGYTLTTLPAGIGAAGLVCSPGGVWGDFVYVADSAAGRIERIDTNGVTSTFAGPFNFPVGLEFGPGPGNDFGSALYVGDFASSVVNSVNTAGGISSFISFPGPGSLAFDRNGAYGTGLFASSVVGTSIDAIDPSGGTSLFSSVASDYLRFGPGDVWGNGLYSTDRHGSVSGPDCCFDHDGSGCSDVPCETSVCAADPACCDASWSQRCANLALDTPACACSGHGPGIVQIDVGGAVTSFVDGFAAPQGFDWAEGAGWNGDLFVADRADGVVRRVSAGGITTEFATVAGAAAVSFCNCELYLTDLNGGRWKILSDADDSDMDGTGAACDACPGFHDPPGVTPVFGMTIVASSTTSFSWPVAADVRYARGSLSAVGSYAIDVTQTASGATSFSDATSPASDAGFYYLARPDCAPSSWQTADDAEPGRDLVLP